MSKIRVLPENLANKIAAGEIVERPASIVKELVENAIDAGARTVHTALESGGKKLVLVRDDGEGMSQDDAILAFEHHATSKIQTVDDLGAISTLGFRGEALPSIGSVSRLTLKTRAVSDSDLLPGTEINIQGGVLRSVKAISWDRGTEVAVRDLFFNMPARRKFLRSNETELGHITRLQTHYALAHPELRFALQHEGRILFSVLPTPSIRERIGQLFGDEFLDHLVEISGRAGDIEIHGLSSRPHEHRTNAYSQFIYVNRRMVRDKVIASAVRQAYRHTMPASAYPIVILFIDLPYDQVDVNAHPAKTEIRFRESNAIHDLIRDSISHALERNRSVAAYAHRSGAEDAPPRIKEGATSLQGKALPPPQTGRFEFASQGASIDPFEPKFSDRLGETEIPTTSSGAEHLSLGLKPEMLLNGGGGSVSPLNPGGARILGQIRDSYIIACDNQGLLIIDQHVAHERILYERMALAMQNRSVESQGLLVPVTMELPPHQAAILNQVLPELNRSGFRVERFGGNAVLVRSVPALAGDCDCGRLLTELLEGLEKEDRRYDIERIRDRIAVSRACRAAIKVNTTLTMEKMQWLLDELTLTRIPSNCPHGRPILLRFSLYEIERNFGRA
jgi:DNA mismatch repair protein MutL